MSEPFIGQITVFPYSFPPNGWMDCSGQLLPIQQYAALFSLLGTTYGGNGQTNFGLPNLQGRVPVGQGQLPGGQDYAMGDANGAETVALDTSTQAPHSHGLMASTTQGTANTATDNVLALALTSSSGRPPVTNKGNIYNPAAPATALAPTMIGPAGSAGAHINVQPSLVLRYCIAVTGVFPSRP